MAGVNGVEIKVGQVWCCRDGVEREIGNVGKVAVATSRFDAGCFHNEMIDHEELIELVKDENGNRFVRSTPPPADSADSAALAEETLSALGWTFDGQAWVEPPRIGMVPNALDVQVGGTHYKDLAIQPIEYIHANKLGFAEGNVVKYITRHRQKHGADDVRKVIHYCQLLLELEYGGGKTEGGV